VATLYLLLAAAVGAGTTLQSGINSRLGAAIGPVWAAAVSVSLSFAIVVLMVAVRLGLHGLPSRGDLAGLPWWAWIGGAFGVTFVAVAVVAAPRLGAVSLIAAVVAGQAIAAVVVDEWGLAGFARREVTAGRAAGLALVVAGVACVRAF
jgi:bacterial/archaeal transporter family-2 protein